MKRNSPIFLMKASLCVSFFSVFIITSCSRSNLAQTDKPLIKKNEQSRDTKIQQTAQGIARYLEELNYPNIDDVRGDDLAERKISRSQLIKNYSINLASKGINRTKLFEVAGSDNNVPALLNRLFFGKAKFEDYLGLAEIAVIARVGAPHPDAELVWSNWFSVYYLNILHSLTGTAPYEKIAVNNGKLGQDNFFMYGIECVFFLSPTRTWYLSSLKNAEEELTSVMAQPFTAYCESVKNIFILKTPSGEHDHITRSELLTLVKPIK